MRLQITIDIKGEAFDSGGIAEVHRVIQTAYIKVSHSIIRKSGELYAYEDIDEGLMETNGNTCGRVTLTK